MSEIQNANPAADTRGDGGFNVRRPVTAKLSPLDDAKMIIRDASAGQRWDVVMRTVAEFRRSNQPNAEIEHAAVVALRGLDRLDEAEKTLQQAAELFGFEAWVLTESGKLSIRKKNSDQALELAAQLRQRFPNSMDGYAVGAQALRELRRWDEAAALLEAAKKLFPRGPWIPEEQIKVFEALGRFDDLVETAKEAIQMAPKNERPYRVAFKALRKLGRTGEANDLLREAIAALSFQPWLCLEGVENAQAALQFETADCWLMRGTRKFPANTEIALAYAMRPGRELTERRRFRGAERMIERLESLVEEFPELLDAYAALGEALLSTNRAADADRVVASKLNHAKTHGRLALVWARSAEFQERLTEAVSRYRSVLEWFPDQSTVYEGLAVCLAKQGNRAEAERICAAAMDRFPGQIFLQIAQAKIAEVCEDLTVAIQRMEALAAEWPNNDGLKQRLFALRMKLHDEPGPAPAVETSPQEHVDPDDPKSIMMHCQGIGGTGMGCEFGLVQRYFGAEPLSLLRWGGLPHEALVQGLETGFEGVEDETGFRIEKAWRGKDSEYLLHIDRYSLLIHTFMYASEISEDRFCKQMSRRLKFLRQIFLDDLTTSRHLFVRKQQTPIPDSEVDALHAAVSKYGDNTILYVFKQDEANASGTVRWHKPGVIFGYIDNFKEPSHGNDGAMSLNAWLEVCAGAYALWRSHR